MPSFETSEVINLPAQKIFDFITVPENDLLWVSGAIERSLTGGQPLRKGSVIHSLGRFMGRKMEFLFECVELEPNERYSVRSLSGPFQAFRGYSLRPVGDGVVVESVFEGEPGLAGTFGGLSDRLVAELAELEQRGNLAKLRVLLEA